MTPLRRCCAALVGACLCLVVALVGCGGGGGGSDAPAYGLAIDGAAERTTSLAEVVIVGEAFLPPGSSCPGDCSGLMPPPVFGQLGPHTIGWHNDATGNSGVIALIWVCNCGDGPPSWIVRVPLAPGVNRITVTMASGAFSQSASVTITRG
jgi:hypothetical protein